MVKNFIRSKKGLSTAIGTAFFIGIVLISLIVVMLIDSYQTDYLNVREDMAAWDIDRSSELLNITRIVNPSFDPNYSYEVMTNNHGGILTKVARVYVYDNATQNLEVYDRQTNSSVLGLNGTSCEIIPGEGGHGIKVNASSDLDTAAYNRYRIVVCTERGRQFSYMYPPEPAAGGGLETGNYPLIIACTEDNFQHSYVFTNGTCSPWAQAYYKPAKAPDAAPGQDKEFLYRVLINNTTNRRVFFHNDSAQLQLIGAVGGTEHRYIVSNQSTADNLIPFSSQTIPEGESAYLYFAVTEEGGTTYREESSKGYHLIGFLLRFNYYMDPEIRYISMPATPQELY
jgi:hypothetical protein